MTIYSADTGIKKFVYAVMIDNVAETYGPVKDGPSIISMKVDPKAETANVWASNVIVETGSTIGDIAVEIELHDFPLETQADFLGHILDLAAGVMDYKVDDTAPYLAIGYQRTKANGRSRYVWLRKVKFTDIAEESKTSEGKVAFQTPKLSGTAIANKNNSWKALADDDTKGTVISDFLATVPISLPFDAVAPTVATVPLDAATGVAVGASIVYTFNKAINPADVTDGNFFLLKANTPVACNLTLGTNNTVVTMKPTANMTAGAHIAYCTKDVRSAAGVPLAAIKVTSFTV